MARLAVPGARIAILLLLVIPVAAMPPSSPPPPPGAEVLSLAFLADVTTGFILNEADCTPPEEFKWFPADNKYGGKCARINARQFAAIAGLQAMEDFNNRLLPGNTTVDVSSCDKNLTFVGNEDGKLFDTAQNALTSRDIATEAIKYTGISSGTGALIGPSSAVSTVGAEPPDLISLAQGSTIITSVLGSASIADAYQILQFSGVPFALTDKFYSYFIRTSPANYFTPPLICDFLDELQYTGQDFAGSAARSRHA